MVIKEAPKVQYQSVSAVQSLMERCSDSARVPKRKVDPGWLGRIDSDSGIASSSASSPKERADNYDSSDEVICDSDEESKSRYLVIV